MESEPEINDAYQYIQNNCKYNGNIEYTFGKLDDMYYNATRNIIQTHNAASLKSAGHRLDVPVETDPKSFDSHYRVTHVARRQYEMGSQFGVIMISYWMGIAFMASLFNLILTLYPEVLQSNIKLIRVIRKHFTLPAMISDFHSRPVRLFFRFYLSAPTRGQSIILLGYFALNVIFLVIDYDIIVPNPFLVNRMDQHLRYLGNRSGIISFTQLPLVILFSGRNNILIKLTGWSYNTFQVYHRWVARVMVIQIIIHSVCFTWLAVIGHTVAYRWEDVINWRAGNIAAYSSVLMFIFALSAFRSRFYEVFLFTHKCFYIIFIVGIARHCWDFGWMGWVYSAIGIHALDRFLRVARVIVSGTRNDAYAVIYSDNTFRVSVEYSKRWDLKPGQYCYLRILTRDLFWQAHPFSIYKSPVEGDGCIHFAIKAKNGATKKIADKLNSQASKSDVFSVFIEGPYGVHAPVENYETIFLLAGGMGVTATFSYAYYLKELAKEGQKVIFLWVIQDTTPLEWFEQEMLFLTKAPNIELQIYITRKVRTSDEPEAKLGSEDESNTSSANQTSVVYELDTSNISSTTISEDFKQPKIDFNISYASLPTITVTGETEKSLYSHPNQSSVPLNAAYIPQSQNHYLDVHSTDGNSSIHSEQVLNQFEDVIYNGRPKIQEEVSKFMIDGKGSMALVSCGPPTFIDYIRKSIVSNVKEATKRVDYFEEAFSW